MVVVLANDSDQNSGCSNSWLYGSLMITLLVPSGGLVTVVVLANDSDQNSVIGCSWIRQWNLHNNGVYGTSGISIVVVVVIDPVQKFVWR